MIHARHLFSLAVIVALAACAAETEDDTESSSEGAIEQAVAAQKKPMQKAEDLEQQLKDAQKKQSEEIDNQSGDDG